jgi:hypothetical protein
MRHSLTKQLELLRNRGNIQLTRDLPMSCHFLDLLQLLLRQFYYVFSLSSTLMAGSLLKIWHFVALELF